MTAAQRTTATGVLGRIEQILLQVPELAAPDGFEIMRQSAGGYRLLGPDDTQLPNALVRYNIGLMMFAPSRAAIGEGSVCLSVVVNDNPPREVHRGAGGFQVYVEGDRGAPIPPATQVYGGLLDAANERSSLDVYFVSAGPLPWRPVTREEFINTLIFEAEGERGEKVSREQAAFAKTPYQEWAEGAAQRKRERDQSMAEARTVLPPAEVERMRLALEASERDVTERLRKTEADDRARFAGARAAIAGAGESLRATLAGMTPAERAMPALVNNALSEGPLAAGYRLTSVETPPSLRMLTPNWDFYRANQSPFEVRSIRVSIGLSRTCLSPKVQHALRQTVQTLDWTAVNGLLSRPR